MEPHEEVFNIKIFILNFLNRLHRYSKSKSKSVTTIITYRSEPAYDGAIPHFSKTKSVWSSGDAEKIRDRISMHGHAPDNDDWPPVD